MKKNIALGASLALILLLVACQPKATPATEIPTMEPITDPYAVATPDDSSGSVADIQVSDQAIDQDTVTVTTVNAIVDGWLVIHTEADGKPGPVIGYRPRFPNWRLPGCEKQFVLMEAEQILGANQALSRPVPFRICIPFPK